MNCSTRRLGWVGLSLLLLSAGYATELHAQTVSLSTNQLNFGNQAILTTSGTRSVTLKNSGTAALQITGITPPIAPFSETSTSCSASLLPGKSCTISVTFSPTKAGDFKGSISITDNAAGSPQIVSLKGTGVPQAAVSPNPLIFGLVGVGSTSTAEAATLQNNLNTSLTITSIVASGDFAVPSNTCGSSVPAGGQCQIAVTFTPTQLGIRSGSLTVRDSANNSPQTISLLGTGTFAGLISISVTPANVSIPVGSTQQFTATGTFPTGIRLNLTQLVLWSSSASNVATISNSLGSQGLATGKAAGTTTIKATSINNIFGSTSVTVGSKATATVTLSNLTQTYDGTPKSVTVTTVPSGPSVIVTYNGSTTPPTNAGSYAVVATVNDPNYQGNATGTLTIQPAPATITLSNLTQTYDGTPRSATVTTSPTSLAVIVTYNGSITQPTNAASYVVVASLNNANYTAPNATGSLVINPASATITLGNLTQTYTGSALTPTATTVPANLTVTWTGAPDTSAGTYPVTATVSNPNYTGSASGSFVITPAAATVTLSNLAQTFTGSPLSPTATTVPANLAITWTGAPDSNPGTYPVTATVSNPNYTGSASGSFVISPVAATVTLTSLTQTYTGSTLTPTATTVPAGLAVALTGAPDTNAGTYPVTATVSNPNYTGSASGSFVIGQAAPTVIVTGGTFAYDGTPHAATATATGVSGTSVSGSFAFTYNGSPTTPIAAGAYTVVATFSSADPNYGNASGAGSITITAPTVTLTSIAITPANPSVTVGGTQQFTATGTYSDNSTQNLTSTAAWTSSATNVATISNTAGTQGLATAASLGVTTITATVGLTPGSTNLAVTGTGSFVPGGNMNIARDPFTATLLDDGTVLIAGGYGSSGVLDTAELSDPLGQTMTPVTAPMASYRAYHTATLLNNGMVLLVGGLSNGGLPTTSAELFDSIHQTFTSTGNLSHERYLHTATLLRDGTVLIAGGIDGSGNALSLVELYNPATGAFISIGSLNAARYAHTATLLNDGTVLFAGGGTATPTISPNATYSAELYTSTGTFTLLSNTMNSARAYHTATLLNDGTVLLAGGVLADRASYPNPTDTADIYDPGAQSFTPTNNNMSDVRAEHTATLLSNGMVLVVGGADDNTGYFPPYPIGAASNSVDLYDPNARAFTATSPLSTARSQHTATLLNNGEVLIAGGTTTAGGPNTNGAVTNTTELYQPASLTPPGVTTITVNPGNLTSVPLGTSQRFTATDNNGHQLSSVKWSSSDLTVAVISNDASNFGTAHFVGMGPVTVQACAGSICRSTSFAVGPAALVSIAVTPQNPVINQSAGPLGFTATGTFTDGPPQVITTSASTTWNSSIQGVAMIGLNTGVARPGAVGQTTITATSGNVSGSTTLTVTTFVPTGSMSTDRQQHTATLLNNEMVLVAGGASQQSGGALASAELYNPATGTFSPTGSLNFARRYSSATLLNDGTVLITGGVYISPSGSPTSIATAEIYNPGNGTFIYTNGGMTNARYEHTATVLRCTCADNGKVLIAGGYNEIGGALNSADLYDPLTGTFTPIAPLGTSRYGHSATTLNDGSVLIAGGLNGFGTPNTVATPNAVELYDPAQETFTTISATLGNGLAEFSATLLNGGKVLFAGGSDILGNWPNSRVYDPTTQTFTMGGALNLTYRTFFTSTLLNNGTVLLTGGVNATNATPIVASTELYDPALGTFSFGNTMLVSRALQTATLLSDGSGKVLIAGGVSGSNYFLTPLGVSSAELYPPSTLTPPNLVSIAVAPVPANQTIVVGATQRFIATGTFNVNGVITQQQLASVTWSASDSSGAGVAQISNDATNSGVAVGLSAGMATITACTGTTCSAPVTLTVQ